MRIVSATSLVPTLTRPGLNEEQAFRYQLDCYESVASVSPLHVAVNYESEVDRLHAGAKDLKCITVPDSVRTERGTRLMYFDRVKHAFKELGADYCCVVNGDIFLDWTPEIMYGLIEEYPKSLIWVPRIEVTKLGGGNAITYWHGLDMFMCPMSVLDKVALDDFAFGMPWWDYAFPAIAAMSGVPLVSPRSIRAYHLTHETRWSPDLWRQGLYLFSKELKKSGNPNLGQFTSAAGVLNELADVQMSVGTDHNAHLFHGGALFARMSIDWIRRRTAFVN